MREDKPEDIGVIRKWYAELADIYDEVLETFEVKVGERLRWELLKEYLPKDRGARILDAGGGTGRLTLQLAKMGYQVTICDLTRELLRVAEAKLRRERVLDRVEIDEADITSLPYADESFDFVICIAGPLSESDSTKAARELARVTRKGGRLFADGMSRYWAATRQEDIETALKLIKSELNYACAARGQWRRVFSPEEFTELFERNGIRIIKLWGRFEKFLPEEIQKAKEWDENLFSQVVEMVINLSKEPSIIGMAGSLILIGEKAPQAATQSVDRRI
jgi:ubiquinone/menaquinone biosynthesis C-methylase UbiE